MINRILKYLKRKHGPLSVRVEYYGEKEENKRHGRRVRVIVSNGRRTLSAKVHPDLTGRRWAVEPEGNVPPIEVELDERTRSSFAVAIARPRTRLHATAVAAAHLGRLLR